MANAIPASVSRRKRLVLAGDIFLLSLIHI